LRRNQMGSPRAAKFYRVGIPLCVSGLYTAGHYHLCTVIMSSVNPLRRSAAMRVAPLDDLCNHDDYDTHCSNTAWSPLPN